jgi:methylmalonyl-CoA mutase, C-terminal domain
MADGMAEVDTAWWQRWRPRVLLAIFGFDQHEVGAMAVGKSLRDAGAEVIYIGRFAIPDTIVATAMSEDADLIGVSCHSWEYRHYAGELLAAMARAKLNVPVVLGGSVFTESDVSELIASGIADVIGPQIPRASMLARLQELIESWSTPGTAGPLEECEGQ